MPYILGRGSRRWRTRGNTLWPGASGRRSERLAPGAQRLWKPRTPKFLGAGVETPVLKVGEPQRCMIRVFGAPDFGALSGRQCHKTLSVALRRTRADDVRKAFGLPCWEHSYRAPPKVSERMAFSAPSSSIGLSIYIRLEGPGMIQPRWPGLPRK